MSFFSNIKVMPRIKKDKIEELNHVCYLTKRLDDNRIDRLPELKNILTNGGVPEHLQEYIMHYLGSIEEVTPQGYIIMEDYDQAWKECDLFANFLEKYVDDSIISVLSFTGEDGSNWQYKYVYGHVHHSNSLAGNDINVIKQLGVDMDSDYIKNMDDCELEAFKSGMRFAWDNEL